MSFGRFVHTLFNNNVSTASAWGVNLILTITYVSGFGDAQVLKRRMDLASQ